MGEPAFCRAISYASPEEPHQLISFHPSRGPPLRASTLIRPRDASAAWRLVSRTRYVRAAVWFDNTKRAPGAVSARSFIRQIAFRRRLSARGSCGSPSIHPAVDDGCVHARRQSD